MSNSAINKYIIAGPSGNIGPTGATGATGLPGQGGAQGTVGEDGVIITGANVTSTGIQFLLSNNTNFTVTGNFKGATLEDKIFNVDNLTGSGYTLFASISSGVMNFRGISAIGSLQIQQGETYIDISTIYTSGKGSLNPAVVDNTLLYLESPNTANSTTVNTAVDSSSGIGVLDFGTTDAFLNDRVNIKYYGPIEKGQVTGINGELEDFAPPGTSSGIYLDLNAAGVHVLRTPIGIAGFTGIQNNATQSTVLVFDSDDVWKFPSNVFFENGENYLTCGRTIVSLYKFKPNENIWLAKVAARGLDVNFNSVDSNGNPIRIQDLCVSNSLYGSCCYQNSLGQPICNEYVRARDCEDLFGSFHPGVNCSEACGVSFGACCSSGKCVDDSTFSECQYFGGRFWKGITCGSIPNDPDGPNHSDDVVSGRLCYGGCPGSIDGGAGTGGAGGGDAPIACCKDGYCLGDNFTRIECEILLGGISINNTDCQNANCCSLNIGVGACCTDSECISDLTPKQCTDQEGVYMGEGSICSQVNCDCVSFPDVIAEIPTSCGGGGGGGGGDPTGACCYVLEGNSECTVVTSTVCTALNGSYKGDNVPCTPDPCGGGGGGGNTCPRKCSGCDESACTDFPLQGETMVKRGVFCFTECSDGRPDNCFGTCVMQYETSPGSGNYVFREDLPGCSEIPTPYTVSEGVTCLRKCIPCGACATSCGGDPINTGACCQYSSLSGSWNCSTKTQSACEAASGEYKGNNTSCDNIDCTNSTATGACCVETFANGQPTYSCNTNKTAQECSTLNGTWYINEDTCPDTSPCGNTETGNRDCGVYGGQCFFDTIGDHHPTEGVRYVNGFWAPRPSGFNPASTQRYYVPGDSKCAGQATFRSPKGRCASTGPIYGSEFFPVGDEIYDDETITSGEVCLSADVVSEGIAWMMSLYGNLAGLVDTYGSGSWGSRENLSWPEGPDIYKIFTKDFTQENFQEFLDEYKGGQFASPATWANATDPDFPALALQLRMMAKSDGPGDAAWFGGSFIGGNDFYSSGTELPQDWITYYSAKESEYDSNNSDTHLGTCCNYRLSGECYIVTRADCYANYNTFIDVDDDGQMDLSLIREPYVPGTNQVWKGNNYVAGPEGLAVDPEKNQVTGFVPFDQNFYNQPGQWVEKVQRAPQQNYCNACGVDQKYPARSWSFGNIWEIYSLEKYILNGYTAEECAKGTGLCPGAPTNDLTDFRNVTYYNYYGLLDDGLIGTEYGPQGSTGHLPYTGCFGEYSYVFGDSSREEYAYNDEADAGWCCWCEETPCSTKRIPGFNFYKGGIPFVDTGDWTFGEYGYQDPQKLNYTVITNSAYDQTATNTIAQEVKNKFLQYGCTDCVIGFNTVKRLASNISCGDYFRQSCADVLDIADNPTLPCQSCVAGQKAPGGDDRPCMSPYFQNFAQRCCCNYDPNCCLYGFSDYACRQYVNSTSKLINDASYSSTPTCGFGGGPIGSGSPFSPPVEVSNGHYPSINNVPLSPNQTCKNYLINHGPGWGIYNGGAVRYAHQYGPPTPCDDPENVIGAADSPAVASSPYGVFGSREVPDSYGFRSNSTFTSGLTCGMINPWIELAPYNPYSTTSEHLTNISSNSLIRCYCRKGLSKDCRDRSLDYPRAQHPDLWTDIAGKPVFLGPGPKKCTKCGCDSNGENCREVSPRHPIQPNFVYDGENIGKWYHNTEWVGEDIEPKFYPSNINFDLPFENGGLPRSGGKRWYTAGAEENNVEGSLIRSDFLGGSQYDDVYGYRKASIYDPNENANQYPELTLDRDKRRLGWDNCLHWLSGSTYGQQVFDWKGRYNYKWTLRELVNLRSKSLLEGTGIGYYGTPHTILDVRTRSEIWSRLWRESGVPNGWDRGGSQGALLYGYGSFQVSPSTASGYEFRYDLNSGYQKYSGVRFDHTAPFFEFDSNGVPTHPIVPLSSTGKVPAFIRGNGTLGEIRFNYPCYKSSWNKIRRRIPNSLSLISKNGANDISEFTGFCNNWQLAYEFAPIPSCNPYGWLDDPDPQDPSNSCGGLVTNYTAGGLFGNNISSLFSGCGGIGSLQGCCCVGPGSRPGHPGH